MACWAADSRYDLLMHRSDSVTPMYCNAQLFWCRGQGGENVSRCHLRARPAPANGATVCGTSSSSGVWRPAVPVPSPGSSAAGPTTLGPIEPECDDSVSKLLGFEPLFFFGRIRIQYRKNLVSKKVVDSVL